MPVISGQEATLGQGFRTLNRPRFAKTRLVVTGIAGEFNTITFRVKRGSLFLFSKAVQISEGTEVTVAFLETIPSASIEAKAPAGVGSLGIVFDVRTGADA